jgi:hypothetical protein
MLFKDYFYTTINERAFHSSPHNHDKFDLTHIGSGEGIQEYGWGLYFAETQQGIVLYNDYFLDRLGKNPVNYEVELHIDQSELLDWDKPYEQQSQKVQSILKNAVEFLRNHTYHKWSDGTGQVNDPTGQRTTDVVAFSDEQLKEAQYGPMSSFYHFLTSYSGSPKKASLGLLDNGIKGITYKSIRAKNFVVFDDTLIEIKKKTI